MLWKHFLLVAAGGAVGAMARFGVSLIAWKAFPWPTLIVNLVGSLLIGYFMLPSGMNTTPRLLLAVGFLGAFTTMSTYSFETIDLWRTGHAKLAAANVAANGIGGPLLALIGWKVAS